MIIKELMYILSGMPEDKQIAAWNGEVCRIADRMTVKELKNILREMPQDKRIEVWNNSYKYGLSTDDIAVRNSIPDKCIWIIGESKTESTKALKALWLRS